MHPAPPVANTFMGPSLEPGPINLTRRSGNPRPESFQAAVGDGRKLSHYDGGGIQWSLQRFMVPSVVKTA